MSVPTYSFGPRVEGSNIVISTYSPESRNVELSIDNNAVPMEPCDNGYWKVTVGNERIGEMYGFILDGRGPFPDPGGRFMPQGISGLSQLVDLEKHRWENSSWKGISLDEYIIEELHVGTFTAEGTYASVEERLKHLSEIGVTAIEIMPVAQFYGTRNWGYDGVYIYSPHFTYGRPEDLMHLVDATHSQGMGVILDVVYNHSGPVGNYLDEFAPFHHLEYKTLWGNCFNLDSEYSDQIREYILQNAIYWLREYRFDALRLDAVHGIVDQSPLHILEEMSLRVDGLRKETGRNIYLIAESDRNDSRLVKEISNCGMGIDAQWDDDFHHAIHTVLTGEKKGYYMDYGAEEDICNVMRNGFLYRGQFSKYLKRKRGTAWDNPNNRLVVCSQNHDQIGNRARGERMIKLAGPEKAKLAALLTILSPYTPLLFMGEEFGDESPFLFFIQADDPKIAEAVRKGRLDEFSKFDWGDGIPDPSAESSFLDSKIRWEKTSIDKNIKFMSFYKKLISIRKEFLLENREAYICTFSNNRILQISYGSSLMVLASLNPEEVGVPLSQEWLAVLDTSWKNYGGTEKSQDKSGSLYRLSPFAGAVFISRGSAFP